MSDQTLRDRAVEAGVAFIEANRAETTAFEETRKAVANSAEAKAVEDAMNALDAIVDDLPESKAWRATVEAKEAAAEQLYAINKQIVDAGMAMTEQVEIAREVCRRTGAPMLTDQQIAQMFPDYTAEKQREIDGLEQAFAETA